jgi:hypothetical protein
MIGCVTSPCMCMYHCPTRSYSSKLSSTVHRAPISKTSQTESCGKSHSKEYKFAPTGFRPIRKPSLCPRYAENQLQNCATIHAPLKMLDISSVKSHVITGKLHRLDITVLHLLCAAPRRNAIHRQGFDRAKRGTQNAANFPHWTTAGCDLGSTIIEEDVLTRSSGKLAAQDPVNI